MSDAFIQIAIDGWSSCGKSTLARDLSSRLGYLHIDSGAMYRAVTLALIERHIGIDDVEEIAAIIPRLQIDFITDEGGQRLVRLDGQVVEHKIRSQAVSRLVSPVATMASVREHLVTQQRVLSKAEHVIMDGRDIGTVVFPQAEVKLFLTASIEVRTQRRYDELIARGVRVTVDDVRQNLQERDHIDSTRDIAPLRQAEDAIVLDSTHLTRDSQLDHALELIRARVGRR